MKILVRKFTGNHSEIIPIEIDENFSLDAANEFIANVIQEKVALVPVKIKFNQKIQTIGEYYREIQGDSRNYHLNAIQLSLISKQEENILEALNLTSLSKNSSAHAEPLISAQRLINTLSRALPEDVQQAMVVRFADNTNMFGETYKDNITTVAQNQASRFSIQVHPYPWAALGAHNVVLHQNPFNELSVALVYNQRRDRRPLTDSLRKAGIPDYFKLPEGYMHPKPCKGGENGIALMPSDHMDEAEELLLKNIPMQTAYETIKEKYNGENSIQDSHYDNTTKDCSIRETHEEIGLNVNAQQVQFVSQREENRLIPTIANVYLIKTKRADITPPELKVDGIEIREGLWGKVNAFRFEADNSKPEKFRVTLEYYQEESGDRHIIEIPMKHALMIGEALRKHRNDEIQKASQVKRGSLFASRENVEANVGAILDDASLNPNNQTFENVLGASPEAHLLTFNPNIDGLPGETRQEKEKNFQALAHLGAYADQYHKKIMTLATAFKKAPLTKPLTADQLIGLAKEGPRIEKNLLSNKAKFFPLARTSSEEQKHKQMEQDRTVNSIPRLRFTTPHE